MIDDIDKILKQIEATQVQNWCIECIRHVTGDDLTVYNEDQLQEYFIINGQPVLNVKDYPNVTLSYRDRYFTYIGDK